MELKITVSPLFLEVGLSPAAADLLRGLFAPAAAPAQLDRILTAMSAETDKIAELATHVTALEARDAAVASALADVSGQLANLKAQAGNDPAVLSAVDAIEARLDKLDTEAPAPAPVDPNPTPPAPAPDANPPAANP